MKKRVILLTVYSLVLMLLFSACGPKPAYKTREGKKKQKYYNRLWMDRG